jgi:integrase
MRRRELTGIRWSQVDFDGGLITLDKGETKNDDARSMPILKGDMHDLLSTAKRERDEKWPNSPWVFGRGGEPVEDFRWAWDEACKRAKIDGPEVPRSPPNRL